MNQKTVKLLRKLFEPPFAESDPRNRTAWRQFKATYKGLPSVARFLFKTRMKALKLAEVNQNT